MIRHSSLRSECQENGVSFLRVTNRVFYSGFTKALQAQETGIAFAAGETFGRGIVTTVRERKIDTELDRFANDFGFRKLDERRVNLEASAFYTGFCAKIGQVLKRFDKFRPAIGISTVIDRVYAEKNVVGRNHLRPGKCVREEDGVARGHVSDWNAVRDFRLRSLLGHVEIVSERGAAEDTKVDLCDAMFFCA